MDDLNNKLIRENKQLQAEIRNLHTLNDQLISDKLELMKFIKSLNLKYNGGDVDDIMLYVKFSNDNTKRRKYILLYIIIYFNDI